MFIKFFDNLRKSGIPVSLREYLTFLEALSKNIGTYEIIMIFTQGFQNVDTLSIITTSVFLRLISYLTLGIIGINKGIKKLKKTL